MSREEVFIPPTPERIAKGDLEIIETERGGREVRSCEHPLTLYFRNHVKAASRGFRITPNQYRAGLMLMGAWAGSGLSSHYAQVKYTTEMRGEALPGIAGESYVAYRAAMDAIRGLTEKRVAYAVCCIGEDLSNCGVFPSGRTARRIGGIYLKSALDDLVTHYGLDKRRHEENICAHGRGYDTLPA